MAQVAAVDPNPTSSNIPVMTSILLARIQVAQREFEAAQATIRAALHLNKERPSGMWTAQDLTAVQALICVRQGDVAEAERMLNELGDTENYDGATLARAEALLARKQYVLAESEEFIRPFLDRGSQIVPLLTLVLETERLTV
jgi:ATP/maltotriose-dependent transcriptional regulator MalT